MKKQFVLPILFVGLYACGGSEGERNTSVCKVENLEISCDSADVYNDFLEMEAAINATFDGETTTITPDQRVEMRRDVTAYYVENKDVLDAIYKSLKKSSGTQFNPAEINKMRLEELALLEADMLDMEEAKNFLNSIEFSSYETDTTLYEYAGEKHYLLLKIKNTSDRTISNVQVSKNVEVDGMLQYQITPTTYLFTAELLSPRPKDESGVAVLEPGQTLFLPFETSEEKIAKPEIVGIGFAD